MKCETCKKKTTGEFVVKDGRLKDGTMWVLMLRSNDCDWMSCDGCTAVIHIHCYMHQDIRYCDACLEKFKLPSSEKDSGYEA